MYTQGQRFLPQPGGPDRLHRLREWVHLENGVYRMCRSKNLCPEGRMIFDPATLNCIPGSYFSTTPVSEDECSSQYTYTKLPEEKYKPCPCLALRAGHSVPAPGPQDAPAPSHQEQQQEPGGHDHGQNIAEVVQQTQIAYECPVNKVWNDNRRICEACSTVLRKNGQSCC